MDYHAWLLKRCGLVKGCAFWGFVHTALHLRNQKTPNPSISGRECVFSSQTREVEKRAYYQNYCIDSNQILHSDKDHEMPFVGGPNTRSTNSRWRTAAILKKLEKIVIFQPRFQRFRRNLARWLYDTIRYEMSFSWTQFDPLDRSESDRYKFEIFKIQAGRGRHLKHTTIAISRQRLDRSARNWAWLCILALRTCPTFSNF